jgi:putative transposase
MRRSESRRWPPGRRAWQGGNSRRFPVSGEEFFLDFWPAVPRLIQRDGIHFHKIRYWDKVLSPWAGRLKKHLLIQYDPRNLARL